MPEQLAPGVYVEEVAFRAQSIEGVSTSTTGFVGRARQGPLRQPVAISSFADFEGAFGGLQADLELGYAALQYFLNGGREGRIVRVNDQSEIPAALSTFEAANSIDMLCIPGITDPATLRAAVAFCDQQRTFMVVDPPSADAIATQNVAAVLSAADTSNAAVYFPPVTIGDPLAQGAPRASAPSGSVAGMIARTDALAGVWEPPAGAQATLVGVLGLQANVDQATAQSLASVGVNSIRLVRPGGTLVWTARTVSSKDQWKLVAVRRLALFVERSLVRGLQWAVFEPNREALWIELSMQVSAFLRELWKQGGIKGSTAEEAFFVRSGRDVMTQADISEGHVVILIGFAPVKPAEFVIIAITVLSPENSGSGHKPPS